jgi:hypothetical protein
LIDHSPGDDRCGDQPYIDLTIGDGEPGQILRHVTCLRHANGITAVPRDGHIEASPLIAVDRITRAAVHHDDDAGSADRRRAVTGQHSHTEGNRAIAIAGCRVACRRLLRQRGRCLSEQDKSKSESGHSVVESTFTS